MAEKDPEKGRASVEHPRMQLLYSYGCIFLWIFLSAAVIFTNKFVLSYSGFPFPIALTVSHMVFCSVVSAAVVHSGYVETPKIDTKTYISAVLPIAVLFSGTLWLGNAAYLHLSVAFIQMLKILLQRRGIKLNPITSLYYISPACFLCLVLPFAFIELPQIMNSDMVSLNVPLLLLSCIAAFALNLSVFLLIGRTSALTMNVAGVIKDWMLIFLSVLLYKSPVTGLQYGGYFVAFLGVCWYNYQKLHKPTGEPTKVPPPAAKESSGVSPDEKEPLLTGVRSVGADEETGGRLAADLLTGHKLSQDRVMSSPVQRLHSTSGTN